MERGFESVEDIKQRVVFVSDLRAALYLCFPKNDAVVLPCYLTTLQGSYAKNTTKLPSRAKCTGSGEAILIDSQFGRSAFSLEATCVLSTPLLPKSLRTTFDSVLGESLNSNYDLISLKPQLKLSIARSGHVFSPHRTGCLPTRTMPRSLSFPTPGFSCGTSTDAPVWRPVIGRVHASLNGTWEGSSSIRLTLRVVTMILR